MSNNLILSVKKVINTIYKKYKQNIKKCIDIFKNNIKKIRTNRVSIDLLDNIYIKYYEQKVPIRKISNIFVENSRTLSINVFDNTTISLIEKAILKSGLGLNPISKNNIIQVPFPLLSEERRCELIKIVRFESEQSKISIRNLRRDTNEKIKLLLKKKLISKDDMYRSQNEIQNITNIYIEKLNILLLRKESELIKN